jgi:hypothetical protein
MHDLSVSDEHTQDIHTLGKPGRGVTLRTPVSQETTSVGHRGARKVTPLS